MATKAQYQRGYKAGREARKHAEQALKDKEKYIAEREARLSLNIQAEQGVSCCNKNTVVLFQRIQKHISNMEVFYAV